VARIPSDSLPSPWGEGGPPPAFFPAGAGRVRGQLGGEEELRGYFAALRRKSRHSRESGNPARSGNVDPRLRGGDDGLTFISTGGPQALDHSA